MKTKGRLCRHVEEALAKAQSADGVPLILIMRLAQDQMSPIQWEHMREQFEAAYVEAGMELPESWTVRVQ